MPARLRGRQWKTDELAGIDEIADGLVVSKSAVVRWADEGLLPRPYDHLAMGRVWTGSDLRQLIQALSLEEPPPDDGKRDPRRARRYAKLLRQLREIAIGRVTWGTSQVDGSTDWEFAVTCELEWLIEEHSQIWLEREGGQNGNPSTGTSSSSETR